MPHGSIERQEILSAISKNSEKTNSLSKTVRGQQHLRGSAITSANSATVIKEALTSINSAVRSEKSGVNDIKSKSDISVESKDFDLVDIDVADDDVPPILTEADLADDSPAAPGPNSVANNAPAQAQTATISAMQQKKTDTNSNGPHLQGDSFAYKSPMQSKRFIPMQQVQQPTRNTDDSLKHLRWIHPLLLVDEPSD
jgi:hypothetical protein